MHSILYPSHTRTRRPGRRTRAAQRWSVRARIIALIFALAAVAALIASVVDLGPSGRTITIPAGASLVAAIDDAISTDSARPGQTVVLQSVEPLVLVDGSSLPAGIVVRGEVAVAKEGGRVAGAPELAINFTEMEVEGQSYPIEAEPFRTRGNDGAGAASAAKGGQIVLPDGQLLRVKLLGPVTVQYSGKSGPRKP